jgi:hypothetical protein
MVKLQAALRAVNWRLVLVIAVFTAVWWTLWALGVPIG